MKDTKKEEVFDGYVILKYDYDILRPTITLDDFVELTNEKLPIGMKLSRGYGKGLTFSVDIMKL